MSIVLHVVRDEYLYLRLLGERRFFSARNSIDG